MARQTKKHTYENNPFFIAASGIALLANRAQGIFVFLIMLSIIGIAGSTLTTPEPTDKQVDNFVATVASWSASDWIIVSGSLGIIFLALAVLSALLGGVSSYTSAQLAKGKQVRLSVAFRVSFEHLWAYLWLQVLICIKLLLWTLLLVVPGIIMAFRYSLAGVAFFDDKHHYRGNAAIKESLRLTKNAWITTYASNMLFNILSLGAISPIVSTGVNATLYRQFSESRAKKPEAHWLSWATLFLPLGLLAVFLAFAFIVAVVAAIIGTYSL